MPCRPNHTVSWPWTAVQKAFGVEILLIAFATAEMLGIILSYIVSVATDTSNPICPMISFTGAYPPASGILTITLVTGAPLLVAIVLIRYKQMKGFTLSRTTRTINASSLIFVGVTATGMVGVASFRAVADEKIWFHEMFTLLIFCGEVILTVAMTTTSINVYRNHRHGNWVCLLLQLLLSAVNFLMVLLGVSCSVYKYKTTPPGGPSYSTPRRFPPTFPAPSPLDCVKATCEWSSCLLMVLFLLTLHGDFRRLVVRLDVRAAADVRTDSSLLPLNSDDSDSEFSDRTGSSLRYESI